MYTNILLLSKLYEEKLRNLLKMDIIIHLNIGTYRCMARIADFKNSNKSRLKGDLPNINKRCTKKVCDLGLCNMHLKNLNYGRVDEYPGEEMLYYYKKKDKDILSKINLHQKEFCSNIKLKSRTNLNVIIRMSIEKPVYKESIKKIIKKYTESSIEDLYNSVLLTNKINKQFLTIEEKNKILEDIRFYKSKNTTQKLSTYIRNIDVSLLNNIRVRDSSMNSVKLYKLDFNKSCYLINSNKNIIGRFQEWIDDEDCVPKEYKTADNKVLHPISNLPIIEVTLNYSSEIYCGVYPGIYREYNYNEEIDAFMSSNSILV